ncbi:MAG: ATPase, T2SS/T4P/T4SS family [Deltaproteobacteria bacterium]|nr:ATPase, T2SS/T4P/T4SS family [Deltaproteobacteria bacterium]
MHFEPWNGGARVRLRVDGHLQDAGELSAGWARTVVQRVRETLESPGEQGPHLEGFIRSPENGTHGLYYVTIVASRRGPSVTFIDISAPEFGASLSELAVPTEDRDELIELLRARSGVVLVAGTNRAQKLRFFDLLLREKKAAERKTFTLGRMPWFSEDRYIQVRVRTEEAGEALDALRVIAEQEPDIVAVEDAWNERVVALIFQSVQRPVLCMAGLHLRTALAALEYTLDAVPNRTLVAEGLRGVVAVAAFRRLCPECRKPDERTAEAARKLGLSHAEIKAGALRRAEGCAVCGGGFSGLVPVVEVLRVDRETAEYLKIEESGPKIRDHLLAKGYRAIDVKVRNLILAGEIEFDEYPYAEGG